MCWCAARCLLPGRPTAAQSADAAGGACPRLESPQKSNALCPGQRCPSGSEAPDPDLCRREMTYDGKVLYICPTRLKNKYIVD